MNESAIQYSVRPYVLENAISVLKTRNVMGHPSNTSITDTRRNGIPFFFFLLLLARIYVCLPSAFSVL
jgi:hypothetical protein